MYHISGQVMAVRTREAIRRCFHSFFRPCAHGCGVSFGVRQSSMMRGQFSGVRRIVIDIFSIDIFPTSLNGILRPLPPGPRGGPSAAWIPGKCPVALCDSSILGPCTRSNG